jgi:hypothetical protein
MMRRSRTAEKKPTRTSFTTTSHGDIMSALSSLSPRPSSHLENAPPKHPPGKNSSLRHLPTESQNFSLDPKPPNPSRTPLARRIAQKVKSCLFRLMLDSLDATIFVGNLRSQWRLHRPRFDSAEGRARPGDNLMQLGETFSLSPISMNH